MAQNDFALKLMALLDKQKSKAQINSDIKELEGVIRKIKLIGTFSKGNTKSELNQAINQMESQLKQLKIKTKIDSRQLNREINTALRGISARELSLSLNSGRFVMQLRRALSEARALAERSPINVNVNLKRDKLQNQLSTFLNRNTKINESSYWLNEADRLRTVIGSVTNREQLRDATDQLGVFTSGVRATGYATVSTTDKIKGMLGSILKVGNYFGLAFVAVNKFRQSLGNLKEMDTILTEISKTTDLTIQKLEELGDKSYSIASKYGVLAKDFMTSMQEMSRAGFGDGKALQLAELATLAQSAGALTSELANDYLIASNAAYGYHGNVEKLNGLLDSQNQVTNRNAVSMTELADATKVAANQLSNAAISEKEMTALLGTGIATTKESGAVVGRAVKAIIMNLQQVKNTDEGLETTEEDLGKVESRLASLGIRMKETVDGIVRLRNPIEVLKELAKTYNSLPKDSAERANIISDIGGKYRGNVLSSILSNWKTYEKMLGDYENAEGSALREAQKSADSWEGRLHQLQNTWDSFVNSITSKDSIKGGISFLDTTIQSFQKLTDTLGAIPVLLTAVNASMSSLNKNYGITQLYNRESGRVDIQGNFMGIDFTALKAQKLHFREAAEAMSVWNSRMIAGTADINIFDNAVVQNNAQLKAYLQTTSTQAPASLAGYRAYLNAAGVSTDALRLKTVLMTSALTLGLTLGIQAAVMGIAKLINAEKELAQSTRQNAQANKDSLKAIEDYSDRYKTLHKELTDANTTEERQLEIKDELLSLQQELNEKYGDEYDKVNLVTGAYEDQIAALQKLNKEVAQQYLHENAKGIEKAKTAMTTGEDYFLSNNVSSGSEVGNALRDLVKEYEKFGMEIKEQASSGTFSIKINADPTQAKEIINDFMADVDLLKQSVEDTSSLDKVYNTSSQALGDANKRIEKYGEQYNQALLSEIAISDTLSNEFSKAVKAVDAFNTAMMSGDTKRIEKAKIDLDEMKDAIDLSSEAWKPYADIVNDVFDQADTRFLDFSDRLKNGDFSWGMKKAAGKTITELRAINDAGDIHDPFVRLVAGAEKYGLSLEDVITILQKLGVIQESVFSNGVTQELSYSDTIDELEKMSKAFSALDSSYAKFIAKDKSIGFEDLQNISEQFKGVSGIETFVKAIQEAEGSAEDTQEAFNNLLAAYINQSGILEEVNEGNAKLIESYLEEQGVANADIIVQDALQHKLGEIAAQKYMAANASFDLANATGAEINAFIDEAVNAGVARASIIELMMAKISCNETGIVTDGDINNLIALANAAGIAEAAIKSAKSAQSQKNANGVVRSAGADNAINSSIADNLQGNIRAELYKPKEYQYSGGTDTNSARGANSKKGGGSKSTNKDLDWIERELNLLDKKRENLEKKMSNTYIDFLGITEEQFNYAKELLTSQASLTAEQFFELSEMAQKAGLSIGEFYTQLSSGNWTASRQSYLIQSLDVIKTELGKYDKAIELYQANYEQTISKINPQYRDKIENGFMSIDILPGAETEGVQAAISAYDKLTEVREKQAELRDKEITQTMEYYELIRKSIQAEKDTIKGSNELIESYMDYLKSAGEMVGAGMYEQLIGNIKNQLALTKKEIANKRKELNQLLSDGSITVDSEEYHNLKNEISDSEEELYKLRKSQEEYNFELLQLPINNLSTVVSMYQDINKAIENWGSQIVASGKKLTSAYYQGMIENSQGILDQLQKEAGLIEDAMDEFTEGSDNWLTLYNQLRDVNSTISTTVEQMHQMNEELLKLPLTNISTFSSELQTVLNGLKSVKDEYGTVISAVTGAIQVEVDALKEENDVTNETYKNKIDALKEQLDLLEKINTEKNLQYALEKAQLELERVKGQDTNKVLKNGIWDQEKDLDAINTARKEVEDAQNEIVKNNLKNQIEDLNSELEGINEKYNEQAEALQKQSDKWSEIVEKIQQVQNEDVAGNILGDGWKDKVLSGNDNDIFRVFEGAYQANADQIAKYEKQIATTENISALLQNYIDSYKEGTITYDQAQEGIYNLLSQISGQMSPLENLQNIYDYMGGVHNVSGNADAILRAITSSLNEAAENLTSSLEQYDKNSGLISKYESSWQQLTNNVEKMLDVMKEVRDNLKHSSRDDDDDDDKKEKKHSSDKTFNSTDTNGIGPASDPDLRKHHKGVLAGRVDNKLGRRYEMDEKLRAIIENPPNQLESLKIVKNDEWIFTNPQVENLLKNFNYTSHLALSTPIKMPVDLGGDRKPSQQINFNGGIQITEAQNVTDIADGIMRGGLKQALLQATHRR